VENIKTQLLEKLEDITVKADPNQDDDEALTLISTHYDEETEAHYELCVELIARKDEIREPGNYHADRGDHEGAGRYYVVCGISIQSVYVFVNGDEAEFTITNQEAYDAIKF